MGEGRAAAGASGAGGGIIHFLDPRSSCETDIQWPEAKQKGA